MQLGRTISQGVTGTTILAAIPYAMLIVIMVASQYFQQWHATRAQTSQKLADMTDQQRQQQKTQQMITRVMPLFIGFISWNFPAGLAVYWATGNVFRLGQQFAIFAIDGRPGTSGDDGGPKGSEPGPPEGDGGADGDGSSRRPHPVSEKKRRRRRR
jgi:membrane protein insertase Oxa1/YidC/SpoIIIJ